MKVYALFADSIQVVPYLYSMNLQLATYKCLLSISMSTSQSVDMDHFFRIGHIFLELATFFRNTKIGKWPHFGTAPKKMIQSIPD